jgi:hypothetical protein
LQYGHTQIREKINWSVIEIYVEISEQERKKCDCPSLEEVLALAD